MKKIVIITFYFGEKPWYLNYFLESCSFNKTIDFIFFTDIQDINKEFQNIKIIETSFENFKSIINQHYSFEVNILEPLKICDIRPAFGEIFQDLISDYDFWGYCDIDIIFGDIRSFLDEEVLENNDVVFSKFDYPSGFFAIYRNTILINKLYRSSDYVKTFQNSDLLLFDECGGYYDEVCCGINILDTQYELDSMHHILERNKNDVKVLYEFYSIEASPGKLLFKEGKLIFSNEYEILLYHLTNFKTNYYFNEVKDLKQHNYNSYYIGKYKISKSDRFSIIKNIVGGYLKPKFTFLKFKIDLFISNDLLHLEIKKNLAVGNYKYMKRSLGIKKENNNYYIEHSDGVSNKIYFLKCHENVFYEKCINKFYIMEGLNNDYYTSFFALSEGQIKMNYKLVL